jgi:hypothetical protein
MAGYTQSMVLPEALHITFTVYGVIEELIMDIFTLKQQAL